MIHSQGGTVTVEDSVFEQSLNSGIYADGGTLAVKNVTFTENQRSGIEARNLSAESSVSQSKFRNNQQYALYNGTPDLLLDATENDWGAPSGPYHPSQNPNGQGDTISNGIRLHSLTAYGQPHALNELVGLAQDYVEPTNSSSSASTSTTNTPSSSTSSSSIQSNSTNNLRCTDDYDADQDVVLLDGWGRAFSESNPIHTHLPVIIITHGWNNDGETQRFRDLAEALLISESFQSNYTIVRLVWAKGASERLPFCASRRTIPAAQAALDKLHELGYRSWDQTLYIGESFGNAVNAHLSEKAAQTFGTEKGQALILNAANWAGYSIDSVPNYTRQFHKSIIIQTRSLADDQLWLRFTGERVILYNSPDCNGSQCLSANPLEAPAHSAGIRLITCLLGGYDRERGCGLLPVNPTLAYSLITSDYDSLNLTNRVGYDGCIVKHPDGFYLYTDDRGIQSFCTLGAAGDRLAASDEPGSLAAALKVNAWPLWRRLGE